MPVQVSCFGGSRCCGPADENVFSGCKVVVANHIMDVFGDKTKAAFVKSPTTPAGLCFFSRRAQED